MPSQQKAQLKREAQYPLANGQPNPEDIAFLHTSIHRYPYVTSLILAAARLPLQGDGYSALYPQFIDIMAASPNVNDQRRLARALLRDGRPELFDVVHPLSSAGDSVMLLLLEDWNKWAPVRPWQLRAPTAEEYQDLEVLDDSEWGSDRVSPASYRLYELSTSLENYLYQNNYPPQFCQQVASFEGTEVWEAIHWTLTNLAEQMPCGKTSVSENR